MDKREANIDLVFRNGLKDFEVIPPPDVWDNIHPVIKIKKRPVYLISAAASVAVIFTLSFLAYQLSRQINESPDNSALAVNQEPLTPLVLESAASPVHISQPLIKQNQKGVIVNKTTPLTVAEQDNVQNYAEVAAYPQETNRLTFENPQQQPLYLAPLNRPQKKSIAINNQDLQYSLVNVPKKIVERWSIAAMASPTYYSKFSSGTTETTQQLASSEQPLISYAGGVAFSYKISKRITIQSGLYYSSLGQVVDGVNTFTGFQPYDNTKGDHNFEVSTTNGTIYTNNTDVFLLATGPVERIATSFTSDVFDPKKASLQYVNNTLRQTFSYLEMPVLVRYKFIDKVVDFNLIGGVSYNLLVNNSVYTMVNGSKYNVGETEGLSLITVSSSLGMGMEYNISPKLSLNLEPTIRYYLNPLNGTSASSHPYSFGIFSGVSYRF